MTDAGLLEQSAAGDPRAFGIFAERHGAYLLALLKRFGLGREDAEDTAQLALLKAYKAAATYSPDKSAPRTWLSTIALNLARNNKRGRGRQKHAYGRFAAEAPSVVVPRPVEAMEFKRRRNLLEQSVAELPEDQRAVLLMRIDASMSFALIAEQLGISPAAAKQRFHRAARRLKEELGT